MSSTFVINDDKIMTMSTIKLSGDLLLAVKKDTDFSPLTLLLKSVRLDELNSDEHKTTFWINIYNAFYQILVKKGIPRKEIFNVREIEIAHTFFSLDEIEHGILRKRKWKYSLGYFPSPFYRSIIKKLEVTTLDFRIHFALNCGAESCPAIAFYHLDKIDEELDLATLSFLEQEIVINHTERTIEANKILLWYKADFGRNKGIKKILMQYLAPASIHDYNITFREYDYTPTLGDYTT